MPAVKWVIDLTYEYLAYYLYHKRPLPMSSESGALVAVLTEPGPDIPIDEFNGKSRYTP